jgi:DNA-binding SARP family transcriptional activator/tetratricopeptide (TPR) repeat protein/RecA/RadA recombinase
MRYRILGPLSVTDDGQPVAITAGRDRIVLAMLLLHSDRVVDSGTLIEAVWGIDPPTTARGQLQSCVSRLRRSLPPGAIESDPAGYRLRCPPDDLDAAEFARLTGLARASGDAAPLREALALWRGDALVGIDSLAVRTAAAALDEQHAAAAEDWAELELAAGRDRRLVGELGSLVERFPLRERLWAALIRALVAAGRPADALAEYRRVHDLLRAELGLEPGAALRDLQLSILRGDAAPPAAPAPPPMIRCLPRTVGDFTGRDEVVARLLARAGAPGPVVLAVDGMPGSGKTTLALHVAARAGNRYPDAHLFVDLHGHSDREPLDPAAALLILLRQLGVAADRIPDGAAERVALWRTELAERRALVVLDNAAGSHQVADLLPAGPGTLALVTSRRRLAGLDGVHPESLPVLDEDEAVTLLARIAGDRIAAQPAEAAEVARRCGGLPLALRLAGARLAHRPRWQVGDLARRIGTSALPELAAESRSVAGAFALSYGQLTEPARRVFRLLGVAPGRSFDAPHTAALTGLPLPAAADVLDALVDVHLVEEPEPGFFRLHDLLREYASALAAELPEEERRSAVVAALDFEVYAAALAVPVRRLITLRDLGGAGPARPDLVAAVTEPEDRMERTRPGLAALQDAAIRAERPDLVWKVARGAWRFLWTRGYTDDIAALFTVAHDVARRAGDLPGQAVAANYLASTHYLRGRLDQARALMTECIRLRAAAGDRAGLALALNNLAVLHNAHGEYADGAALAERAMRTGDQDAAPRLDVLSFAYSFLGRHDEAIHLQRRRLLGVIEQRDTVDIGHSLMHLIKMRLRAGRIRPEVAERRLRFLRREMARNQFRAGERDCTVELGDLLRSQGRHAEAIAELTAGLAGVREYGDARTEPEVLNKLACALLESGDPAGALPYCRRALELARRTAHRYELGRALLGLGDCLAGTDPAAAREHWIAAGRIFAELRVTDRAEAERRLDDRVPAGVR